MVDQQSMKERALEQFPTLAREGESVISAFLEAAEVVVTEVTSKSKMLEVGLALDDEDKQKVGEIATGFGVGNRSAQIQYVAVRRTLDELAQQRAKDQETPYQLPTYGDDVVSADGTPLAGAPIPTEIMVEE